MRAYKVSGLHTLLSMLSAPERGTNLSFRSSTARGSPEPELGLPPRETSPSRSTRFKSRRHSVKRWLPYALAGGCSLGLLYTLAIVFKPPTATDVQDEGPLLISYSYFQKDDIQRANADFFFSVGLGFGSTQRPLANSDFVMVVQGSDCSPCQRLRAMLEPDPLLEDFKTVLSSAWSGVNSTLLWRRENEGMDFAAHNVSMEWSKRKGRLKAYKYFIFLNSSVRGPFVPKYLPTAWQWTRAFTDRLVGDVRAVSASLVCLPDEDAGGYGPKLESWAFAMDAEGLAVTTAAGVFWLRTCKLCADDRGIVVRGEYGITQALFAAGHGIATLLSRYAADVDWRDATNWRCNDNVHPSRHGTYGGVSMNPYETIFVKASWHVGEPHLERYTDWLGGHAEGRAGTSGEFDSAMYRYAISEAAQQPTDADSCFDVLGRRSAAV